MYTDTIKNDDPKKLNVDIHYSIQRKTVQDAFSQRMDATKPTIIKYKSNWGVNDVVLFRVGYKVAGNKGGCLKSFIKYIKPNIIQ